MISGDLRCPRPHCRSGAVVAQPIPGDASTEFAQYACATCGHRWSDLECRVGRCDATRPPAVAICDSCSRTLCEQHARIEAGGPICAACARRRERRHARRGGERAAATAPAWWAN